MRRVVREGKKIVSYIGFLLGAGQRLLGRRSCRPVRSLIGGGRGGDAGKNEDIPTVPAPLSMRARNPSDTHTIGGWVRGPLQPSGGDVAGDRPVQRGVGQKKAIHQNKRTEVHLDRFSSWDTPLQSSEGSAEKYTPPHKICQAREI